VIEGCPARFELDQQIHIALRVRGVALERAEEPEAPDPESANGLLVLTQGANEIISF
jgi:hypothetical protein